jgi:hypothetical protein
MWLWISNVQRLEYAFTPRRVLSSLQPATRNWFVACLSSRLPAPSVSSSGLDRGCCRLFSSHLSTKMKLLCPNASQRTTHKRLHQAEALPHQAPINMRAGRRFIHARKLLCPNYWAHLTLFVVPSQLKRQRSVAFTLRHPTG